MPSDSRNKSAGRLAWCGHERDFYELEPALHGDFPESRHHAMFHAAAQRGN